MNTLKAIAIKTAPKAEMQALENAGITVEKGITGDFRGSQKNRQITILSEPAWGKTCAFINTDLPWTVRRANLLIDGVEFSAADVGKIVSIGEVRFKITQQTNPCSLMDQQHQGLKDALTPEWRGGVCCNVLSAGSIQVGDPVIIS